MNADQLAAEAARDIFTRYLELKGMFREVDVLPFIKSAIEKATAELSQIIADQNKIIDTWIAARDAEETESVEVGITRAR